ncbi:Brp/Blh family beta-carotene 15,15'-dioxygenase [Frigoribacterium salinisoli]
MDRFTGPVAEDGHDVIVVHRPPDDVPDVPGAPSTEALRQVVRRRILAPVTATLAVVTVVVGALGARGVDVPAAVQIVPFAVSVLVVGLPHGALDHVVPVRLRRDGRLLASVAAVVALYVVLGSATAALWVAAPLTGFASFILLTWFHWGQGDRWVDHLLGDGTRGRAAAALTVAARGALPMLVPLVTHPDDYVRVTDGAVRLLADDAGPHLGVPAPWRVAAAAVVAALVVAEVLAVRRAGRPLTRTVTELAVLSAFFAVVPPVLAVGLYFTLWHSVRHVVRLELTDPEGAGELARGRVAAPFGRFLRQAWPITAVAVAILSAVGVALGSAGLGVYLVVLAVLTTPHAAVVTWMDRQQGAWDD